MPGQSWTASAVATSVPELRNAAADYALSCDVGDPPMSDLRLAISEALTNAVLHAYLDRDPGSMTVTVAVDTERGDVTVWVIDDGTGWRARDDSPGAGLGMSLMRKVAASVEVSVPETGMGTEVRMRFPLAA